MLDEREVFAAVIIALVAGMVVGAFVALDYAASKSRVPAEPVPCKCAKCEAKCCEVAK